MYTLHGMVLRTPLNVLLTDRRKIALKQMQKACVARSIEIRDRLVIMNVNAHLVNDIARIKSSAIAKTRYARRILPVDHRIPSIGAAILRQHRIMEDERADTRVVDKRRGRIAKRQLTANVASRCSRFPEIRPSGGSRLAALHGTCSDWRVQSRGCHRGAAVARGSSRKLNTTISSCGASSMSRWRNRCPAIGRAEHGDAHRAPPLLIQRASPRTA